jgi:hypothetical protein
LGLRSPLVGSLPSRLETALTEAVAPINDLVASDGLLTELLGTIKKTINDGSIAGVSSLRVDSSTVTLNGLETAVKGVTQELLGSPISNSSGSLTIDLSTGMIKVDLAKLLKETGVGDLNNLPPNTNLLSDTSIEAVLQGIAEAVQGLTSKVAAAATSALNNVKVTMNLGVSAGCTTVLGVENCLAKGEVTVTGSLADFSGSSGTSPAITTTLAAAGIDFGTGIVNLVKPVLDNAIATTTGPLLKTAIATVTDQLPSVVESTTAPILSTLEPILKQALAQAVRVTINEQPTAAPRNGVGDLGPGSFTMRALSMELLPELAGNTGSPLISLGSASVRVAEAPDANANTAANANASSASNANANASSASKRERQRQLRQQRERQRQLRQQRERQRQLRQQRQRQRQLRQQRQHCSQRIRIFPGCARGHWQQRSDALIAGRRAARTARCRAADGGADPTEQKEGHAS